MTRSLDGLPNLLREIAEIAGIEAALALADAVGGTRVDIPARAKPEDWLSDIVGYEAACKIADYYRVGDADGRESGAYRVVIPRGPYSVLAEARRRLVKELMAGTSVRDAARLSGLTERTAWRYKAKLASPDDDPQGRLF